MDAEYAKADLDYLVTIAVREVTGVASPTLLGFPVVEVDDFPSIKGITFGKPLL